MSDKYSHASLGNIFKEIKDKRILIPNFQRKFVWERDKQKKLLASFMVGLPIGSILLLEGQKKDFAFKKLCYRYQAKTNKGKNAEANYSCKFLLDGQQRLSCLWSIFCDFQINDKDLNINELYKGLRTRWYLKVKVDDDMEDNWGWNNLSFNSSKITKSIIPENIVDNIDYRVVRTTAKKSVDELAKEGLIPLFGVFEDTQDSFYKKVIDQISKNRLSIIQRKATEDPQIAINLLSKIDKNIEKYLSNDSEDNKLKILVSWIKLSTKWSSDIEKFLEGLLDNDLSIIKLPKDETLRATAIFGNLNKGGTRLSTFDLIIAKVYSTKQEASLRELIIKILNDDIVFQKNSLGLHDKVTWSAENVKAFNQKNEILENVVVNQFLNILSLICYSKRSVPNRELGTSLLKSDYIKQKSILNLSVKEVMENYKQATNCLKNALIFLQFRCGVPSVNHLLYDLMLLPIAYVLAESRTLKKKAVLDKLEYWYWLSLFSGRYREKQTQRCIEDLKDLYKWIIKKDNSIFEEKLSFKQERFKNLLNVQGYITKELLLQERTENKIPVAITNGILQYVLSKSPIDLQLQTQTLIPLNTWNLPEKLEKHHIIPLNEVTKIGETTKKIRDDKHHILNSPLNLCYISTTANGQIKDYSPHKYLTFIVNNFSSLSLSTHCIPNDEKLFKDIKDNPSDEHVKKFCERRFQELEKDIREELRRLAP